MSEAYAPVGISTAISPAFTSPDEISADIFSAATAASVSEGFSSDLHTMCISGRGDINSVFPQTSFSSSPYEIFPSVFIIVEKTAFVRLITLSAERKFSERKNFAALSPFCSPYFFRLSSCAVNIEGSAPRKS